MADSERPAVPHVPADAFGRGLAPGERAPVVREEDARSAAVARHLAQGKAQEAEAAAHQAAVAAEAEKGAQEMRARADRAAKAPPGLGGV